MGLTDDCIPTKADGSDWSCPIPVEELEIFAAASNHCFVKQQWQEGISGIEYKLTYNISRHFKSFVGRDFKALAQLALYLLTPYTTSGEKKVWLCLSRVSASNY